jgi:glycosyltransferase involved in cell wall biosynthesis
MKIVHIIVGLDFGGAELMLTRLIAASRSSSETYSHAVISLTTAGKLGRVLNEAGVAVYPVRISLRFGFFSGIRRLFKVIKEAEPDIVQTWMYHADLIGGFASFFSGHRNIVWGVRTTHLHLRSSWLTACIRLMCSLASYFIPRKIVFAANSARAVHARLGYCDRKSLVIPNGFDLERFHVPRERTLEFRREIGLGESDFGVGMIGRFHPDKGQCDFVRAAALAHRECRNVRFMMVGRGCDAANAELDAWLDETGCKERFLLLGERSDVPVCLSAMDLFVLPSRTEAFPNVLAEAMAMGVACVATDVGDVREMLGRNGEIVPSGDPWALARGIVRLFNIPERQRRDVGRESARAVFHKYDIHAIRSRYEELYASLMQSGRRGA